MGRLLNLAKIATREGSTPDQPQPSQGFEAAGVDYTQADLAELHQLAARWHELVGWSDGTAETLAMLKRMAPARVVPELAAWRELVREAEAQHG